MLAADAVGLTERFDASLALLERALGVPFDDVCACNVNPFKARARARREHVESACLALSLIHI